MFEKLFQIKDTTAAVLIALLAISVVLFILMKKGKAKLSTRVIVYAGLAIALSFILSSIRIYRMPQGGSITPASMLPLFVLSFMFGPIPGIIAGMLYGFLQLLQDAYIVHWAQVIIEYPLAFACIGLAGFFKNKKIAGILTGSVLRFLCHFTAGFIFFSEYAPEGQNPVLYSFIYNGSFMAVETIITVIIAIPVLEALRSRMKSRM
jgi:thiamine transporter